MARNLPGQRFSPGESISQVIELLDKSCVVRENLAGRYSEPHVACHSEPHVACHSEHHASCHS